MPIHHTKETLRPRSNSWPDVRYNLSTGECRLFDAPEDVPDGWVQKKPVITDAPVGTVLDKDELVRKLIAAGIEIDALWCNAHMKKVLDDCSSSR